MEIVPGIHRIACEFDNSREVYCHLLIGDERSLLIDTGVSDSPQHCLLPYMESIGFDPASLSYIFITHADRDLQEGNVALRVHAPNTLFICHHADRRFVESMEMLTHVRYRQWAADHAIGLPPDAGPYRIDVPMDIVIGGGEIIRLGTNLVVELIHTPGHTEGHTAVYEQHSRTLIAGDAVLWQAVLDKDWQPALPPTYAQVDAYLDTIARLSEIEIRHYSGAHWPLMDADALKIFLDESRDYVFLVERSLRAVLKAAKSPLTLQQLITILKPDLGRWPAERDRSLAYPLYGHLWCLEQQGIVARSRNADGLVMWMVGA